MTSSVRQDLTRLLRPKSIAVFGGQWAHAVIEQCQRMGFTGDIWPVHPSKAEMRGLPCFSSVEALPSAPDVAFIGVNRDLTIGIVEALQASGAGGAVCFASGFAEAGTEGANLQARLRAAARDMPIIGPNCYGLINYLDGALLWPDVHGGRQVERGVAIVTQSSNLAINLTMQQRGLPLAYMLTLGNQAVVGMAEAVRALAEDERVTAIGLHIEGVGDAAAFADAVLAARSSGKPIVVMKSGSSAQAAELTLSHTASLAGSDAVADAFFARLSLARVKSIPAFLESLKLLHFWGPLPGAELVSMSCSGGEASIIADSAERLEVPMPAFEAAQASAIRATVKPLVTVSNPFDYHTFDWGDRTRLSDTFSAVMRGAQAVTVLILDFPKADVGNSETWDITLEALAAAAQRSGGRAAVISTLPECLPEERAASMLAKGVLPLLGVEEAMAAIGAGAFVGRTPGTIAQDLPAMIHGKVVSWDEASAKAALARAGVAVPESQVCDRLETALEAASRLGNVAMKVVSADLAHKTEAGAVVLNLRCENEVRSAYARLSALGETLLVERMIEKPIAELIVGLRRDPAFGLHLLIGAGGIMAEVLEDTKILMLPAGRAEIEAALSGLKIYPLLEGWRGHPAADVPAAVASIESLQAFGLANAAALEELEVNPLIVCEEGHGAFAADALIRMREDEE
ncbi:acetate--CoA ligase family protein [Denitrobaculum tricleocarpae]|uniref:Acetate--CoA ligase family protein n=1 Tax=Denitrobaculum tricleocarpae TaxID=2591009 RepID=A0A545TB43_9PROT|nr:acetate--CoA ligase family protein [Denitrobaculum tricleocarpae]TQV74440.1 acetate--CoA ligase family protein [Denitrobaculum tricleocarpae]